MKHVIAGTALLLLAAGAARAETTCSAPQSQWQPLQTLRQQLGADGWTIHEIKVDDGCYKVEGTDPDGRRIEAEFLPSTFNVVKPAFED